MTKKMMKWFIDRLSDSNQLNLKQAEPYEGQFEDPANASIFPPAAMVVINRFHNETDAATLARLQWSIDVYIIDNYISRGDNLDAMFDLLDQTIAVLHDKPVRYNSTEKPSTPADKYIGRCLLREGEFVGILPGMSVYRLNFTVR